MSGNERRPAGAASEAGGPESSVPAPTDAVTDDAATYDFDLTRMTAEARALWLSVYELGLRDGIDAGRRQLEDEWRHTHEVSAAIARQIAAAGQFDKLEERRGRPERAAAHRRLMVDRGVSA